MKKYYTKPEFVVSDTTQQYTEDDLGALATQDTANKLEAITAERDTLLKELDNLRDGIIVANEQLTKARKDREAIAEQLRRAEAALRILNTGV